MFSSWAEALLSATVLVPVPPLLQAGMAHCLLSIAQRGSTLAIQSNVSPMPFVLERNLLADTEIEASIQKALEALRAFAAPTGRESNRLAEPPLRNAVFKVLVSLPC